MKTSEILQSNKRFKVSDEQSLNGKVKFVQNKWALVQDELVNLIDELYDFDDPKNQPIAKAAIKAINTNQFGKATNLIDQLR